MVVKQVISFNLSFFDTFYLCCVFSLLCNFFTRKKIGEARALCDLPTSPPPKSVPVSCVTWPVWLRLNMFQKLENFCSATADNLYFRTLINMHWICNHGFWRGDIRQMNDSQMEKIKFGQGLKDESKQAGVVVPLVITYNLKW